MNKMTRLFICCRAVLIFGTVVAMPTKDQFKKVFPIVQELMADDIAAVRAGTMPPERAAENALKSASDTSLDEASRYLFLQAAFANYVKAANFDKAVEVVDALKANIKDVPDAALVEFISKQLKYVPREHGGKLYALVQGVRMRSTMTQQLSEYEAEAKKKPTDTIAWSRVGNCAVALNDWAKALAAFSKADGKLAEIAALELKGGDVDAKKIADFWWVHRVLDNDFANSSDVIEQAIKAHAAGWYRKAIADGKIAGVQLQLINKRIADFASEEDSIVESSNRRVVERWSTESTSQTPQASQPPQTPRNVQTIRFDLPGGQMMELVKCKGGTFTMGRKGVKEVDSLVREHKVELTYDFLIATVPVSVRQYEGVMGGKAPLTDIERQICEKFDGNMAICMKSPEATAYCETLNRKLRSKIPNGMVFRLPTEAEWEYAFRAGGQMQNDPLYDNLYQIDRGNALLMNDDELRAYQCTTDEMMEMLDAKGLSREKLLDMISSQYGKQIKQWKGLGDRFDALKQNRIATNWWAEYCRRESVFRIITGHGFRRDLGKPIIFRKTNAWGLAADFDTLELTMDRIPYSPGNFAATIIKDKDVEDASIGKGAIAYADFERDPFRMVKTWNHPTIMCGPCGKNCEFRDSPFRVVIGPQLKPIEQKRKDPQMVEKDAQPPQAFKTTFTTFDLGGGVKLEMAKCPAGKFTMGRPGEKAKDSLVREHQVELTYPFQIATLPITIKQYETVVGKIKGMNPVERQVSDALDGSFSVSAAWRREKGQDVPTVFCEALNKKFKRQLPRGQVFRLPTEAEWEYAMRAGGRQQDDDVFDNLYEGVELSDYERRAYFVTFGECLEMLDKKGLSAENIYELLVKTGIYQKMSEKGKDKVGLLRKHDGWGVFGWCLACEHPWLGRPVDPGRRRNAWGLALVDTGLSERVLDSIPRGSDWYWVEGSSDKDKTIGKGLIAYADIERDPYREYLKKFCEGRIVCSAFNKGVVFGWNPCFRVVIGPQLKPMRGGE